MSEFIPGGDSVVEGGESKAKRYRAGTLEEVLLAVKSDLGPDAVILGSRRIQRGLFLRCLGFPAQMVEITAASGPAQPELSKEAPAEPKAPAESSADRAERRRIREELETMKGLAVDLMKRRKEHHLGQLPEGFYHWHRRIVELGVPPERALEFTTELHRNWKGKRNPSREELLDPVIDALVAGITFAAPIEPGEKGPKQFVFLGPPGAGKTTTLAKVASRLRLRHQADLAILSLDTRRVGAAAQIRTYAEMLGVPCQTVGGGEELDRALSAFSVHDYLLVDTPGLSAGDGEDLDRVAGFLGRSEEAEAVLVLSATVRLASLDSVFDRFRPLRPRRLVLTKLDESVTSWALVESVRRFGGGLSYLSFGQNVPEDIVVATSESVGHILRAVGGYGRERAG